MLSMIDKHVKHTENMLDAMSFRQHFIYSCGHELKTALLSVQEAQANIIKSIMANCTPAEVEIVKACMIKDIQEFVDNLKKQ